MDCVCEILCDWFSPAKNKLPFGLLDGVGFPSHVVRGSEGETRSLPLGSTLSALSMTDSVIKHNLGYSIKKEEQSPAADIIPASPRPKSGKINTAALFKEEVLAAIVLF